MRARGLLRVRLSPDVWWPLVAAGRMAVVPKPYPEEFRRDVVAVAWKGEMPLARIAKDFGILENSITNWMKRADIEDGVKPGVTSAESTEMRDLKRRNRLLEQEAEVMRRALAYFASREVHPK